MRRKEKREKEKESIGHAATEPLPCHFAGKGVKQKKKKKRMKGGIRRRRRK